MLKKIIISSVILSLSFSSVVAVAATIADAQPCPPSIQCTDKNPSASNCSPVNGWTYSGAATQYVVPNTAYNFARASYNGGDSAICIYQLSTSNFPLDAIYFTKPELKNVPPAIGNDWKPLGFLGYLCNSSQPFQCRFMPK